MNTQDMHPNGILVHRAMRQVMSRPDFIGIVPILNQHREVKLLPGHPTMATTGRILYYGDGPYLARQSAAQLRYIIVHEAMHVAMVHHVRLAQMIEDMPEQEALSVRKVANMAMDYGINGAIERLPAFREGYLVRPEGALIHPTYSDGDYTWEQIARRLMQEQKPKPEQEDEPPTGVGRGQSTDSDEQGDGESDETPDTPGSGGSGEPDETDEPGGGGTTPPQDDASESEDTPPHPSQDVSGDDASDEDAPDYVADEQIIGEVLPAEPDEDEDLSDMQEETNESVAMGDFNEKSIGSGSGGTRIMGEIRDTNAEAGADLTDMQEILRSVFSNDRTWTRPNPMYMRHGFVPATQKDGGTLHVAFDLSGSISAWDAEQGMAEIRRIVDELAVSTLKVTYFDTKILRPTGETWEEYGKDDPFTVTLVGRGGTGFNCIFDVINDEGEEVDALVVFTDGWAYVTKDYNPDYEVIWLTTDEAPRFLNTKPFGTVIETAKAEAWWRR